MGSTVALSPSATTTDPARACLLKVRSRLQQACLIILAILVMMAADEGEHGNGFGVQAKTDTWKKKRPKFSFGSVANEDNLLRIKNLALKTGSWRPEIYAIFATFVCFIGAWFLKKICSRVRPPDNLLQELELDDIRIERFDGIESTLMNRLRDPFGYSPMHHQQYMAAQNDEENPEDKYLARNTAQTDSWDIREAAEMLRTKAMKMVFSLTNGSAGGTGGIGGTVNSMGSTGNSQMPIAQQESMRKKFEDIDADVFAENWDARMQKDNDQRAAIRAKQEAGEYVSEKERALLVALGKKEKEKESKKENTDPYRHKKGGPQGKGGGSNWDAWGDEGEGQWDGGEKTKGFSESKGRAPPPISGDDTEHKENSYHAKNISGAAGGGGDEQKSESQFGGRKVGGFQIASPDQWASVRGGEKVGSPGSLAAHAAGGSFSQGSGTLARQNTMQSQGKALLRSPDKQNMTLDLSRVAAAPPSVKPPAPIKYAPTREDGIPVAPMNIPRPTSASTDGSKSRPSSGGSQRNVLKQPPSPIDAPLAPRGVPLPAPRGPPGGMGAAPGGFRPGSVGGSPGYRPGTGGGGARLNPQGSPDATLKIQSRGGGGDDDDDGYSMDIGGSFDPMAGIKKTLPRPTGSHIGRTPPPPSGSSGALSAVNAIGSGSSMGRFPGRGAPPRGAPPAYTGPVNDSGGSPNPTRFMPPGMSPPPRSGAPDISMRRGPAAGGTGGPFGPPRGGPPARGAPPRGAPPGGFKKE